jgi:hypothetical protein
LHKGFPLASRGILRAITSSIDRTLPQLLQDLLVNPYSSMIILDDSNSVKCEVAADKAEAILELGTDDIFEDTLLIRELKPPADIIDLAATDWTLEVLTDE